MKLLLGVTLLVASSIAFAGPYGANGAYKPGYGGVTGRVITNTNPADRERRIEDAYIRANPGEPFRSNPRDQYFDTTTARNQQLIQQRINRLLEARDGSINAEIENLIIQLPEGRQQYAREQAYLIQNSRDNVRRSGRSSTERKVTP